MPTQVPWLIFLLPFLSFLCISLIVRPFFSKQHKLGGYITIGAVGISCALSLWVMGAVMAAPEHMLLIDDISWVVIGNLNIHIGVLVDSLTAVMCVVVTFVSLMVQIYSQGYMQGDPGYLRYYSFMSLFTACMLGLVLANNILFMFVFWEGVGLGSYLLIGFWFHKASAANAAKKAFIVTRLGDFGFLAAILVLYAQTGTFDTQAIYQIVAAGTLAGSTITWVAIGIFSGAAGKSAQFPLHVWLPDAMEGP
ncbi:MAG: proton-conducting transporter membrane subunit, partial [Dehalococcoidia bacterium]